MTRNARTCAFILPYALMLSTALLVIGTLFLVQGEHRLMRMEAESLRSEATTAVRLNVRPLIQALEDQLVKSPASAFELIVTGAPATYRSVLIDAESGKQLPLCSTGNAQSETVCFSSSGKYLEAGLLILAGDRASEFAFAWALEDLALLPGNEAAPSFWPLPDYNGSPHKRESSVLGTATEIPLYLDQTTHGQWREGPWIPGNETLPFRMDSSPALVPVVEQLSLRMGIFASGPVRSREKVIRARFYLEGTLWNPYNRPLQVHYGSGMRSAFQLAFYNLPEIRISNLDRGVSTNWIPLDETENTYSGKHGFHGWIRLPSSLAPGERFAFSEPDPDWQPEGLARTIHPAFPVGPADSISVEIRDVPGGIHIACLPLESSDPLEAALDGAGWFRLEGFPVSGQNLEFPRADSGDRPFYLSGGSLAFRNKNAHLRFSMAWRPEPLRGVVDPRRRTLNSDNGRPHPDGGWIRDPDLVQVSLEKLSETDPATPGEVYRTPLFSWPEAEPQTLVEAFDLPQWNEGFRLGSPGAESLNKLMDTPETWPVVDAEQSLKVLIDRNGIAHPYRRAVPVNMLDEYRWNEVMMLSSIKRTTPVWSAYPWPVGLQPPDFRSQTPMDLRTGIDSFVYEISRQPSRSVSDFFNRGLLSDHLASLDPEDPLHKLIPMRGWLRRGPMLRAHGSAWLLHIAVRAVQQENTVWRSARIWLLETGAGSDTGLEVIQFEWTDREDHLSPDSITPMVIPSGSRPRAPENERRPR